MNGTEDNSIFGRLRENYELVNSQKEEMQQVATNEAQRSLNAIKTRNNPNQLRSGFRDGLVEFMGVKSDIRTCSICA